MRGVKWGLPLERAAAIEPRTSSFRGGRRATPDSLGGAAPGDNPLGLAVVVNDIPKGHSFLAAVC